MMDEESHVRKPESVYNIDEETRMGPETTNDSMLSVSSVRVERRMPTEKQGGGGNGYAGAPSKNVIASGHNQPPGTTQSFSALSFIASEYAESETSTPSPSEATSTLQENSGFCETVNSSLVTTTTDPTKHPAQEPTGGVGSFAEVDNFETKSMSLDSTEKTSSSLVAENTGDVNKQQVARGSESELQASEGKGAETRVGGASAAPAAEVGAFHLPDTFGRSGGSCVPSTILSTAAFQAARTAKRDESMDTQETSELSLMSASSGTALDTAEESTFSRQIENTKDSLLSFPDESVDSTKDVESTTGVEDSSICGFGKLTASKPEFEGEYSNLSMSLMDESSQSKSMDGPPRAKRSRRNSRTETESRLEDEDGLNVFPAERLFEYQWPQDGGEWYLLQEQLSEYLGVKSFKRKYPDLTRRVCDKTEKDFLREKNVVTEHQSDMGLTAVRSDEVYDLMMKDYPEKYHEYVAVLHERQKQTISDKHKEYEVPKLEKSKMADYMKKAAKSAAEFNKLFQRERREERRAYFDLQTFHIQFPGGRYRKLIEECTKPSPYPVALIPGQFQDHYCSYTSDELRYFPVNTALYDPPKKMANTLAKPNAGSESSSEESSEDKSGSTSESGSQENGSSDSEAPATPPPPAPAPVVTETPVKTPGKKAAKKPSKTPAKRNKKEPVETKSEETTVQAPAASTPAPVKPKTQSEDVESCRICKNVVLVCGKNKRVETKMIKCSECGKIAHPTCLDLTEKIVQVISTYPWQCMECKTCVECMDPHDEDKMMFCDRCDRGYHTFCVGLRSLPTGRWECRSCKGVTETPKSRSVAGFKVLSVVWSFIQVTVVILSLLHELCLIWFD
ncbi:hypothetical protein BaRGS_00018557 [Batillaria attramentaria]|uniref:PHD finger protein 10 n=1 Tax=Batillaria attramentaria TaxID=370345 RepID=A0ABD0KTU4_9CAEN